MSLEPPKHLLGIDINNPPSPWKSLPPTKEAIALTDDFVRVGPGYIDVLAPLSGWDMKPQINYDKDTEYTLFKRNASPGSPYFKQPFLGQRRYDHTTKKFAEYQWITYSDALSIAERFSAGLVQLGLHFGSNVALYSENCPAWILAELSVLRVGGVTVPLYSTLGTSAIVHILSQTACEIAVVSVSVLKDLLSAADAAERENRSIPLKHIILMPRRPGENEQEPVLTEPERQLVAGRGFSVHFWEDILESGARDPVPDDTAGPDDVQTIVYTSGTLGKPKGAVLTCRCVTTTCDKPPAHPLFGPQGYHDEVHLSYLPLAHVYEHAFVSIAVVRGCRVGFLSGSLSHLTDDIQALQPTYLLGVPRVWKRIYDTVQQRLEHSPFIKRFLFQRALEAAERDDNARDNSTGGLSCPCGRWYRFILDNVKSILGSRCRLFASGAAPIAPELAAWLSRVFDVELAQLYGLTECSGGALATIRRMSLRAVDESRGKRPFDHIYSAAAYPCPFGIVRIVDAPELGYSVALGPHNPRPRGEVLLRGPYMLKEYYKDPESTREAIDNEGFFHTGDIAEFDPEDSSLTIVDRRKNMFKLAQGEYVPAELLETQLSSSRYISQIWIHGESVDTFIVAVVVPALDALADCLELSEEARSLCLKACADMKSQHRDDVESAFMACENKEVADFLMKEIKGLCEKNKLPHFQYPKGLIVDPVAWTGENDCITPSFKLKRPVLKRRFADKMQQLLDETRKTLEQSKK